jgi:hypothetical protein
MMTEKYCDDPRMPLLFAAESRKHEKILQFETHPLLRDGGLLFLSTRKNEEKT